MKKKYLFLLLGCSCMVMAMNMNLRNNVFSMNNISLANIEALADVESMGIDEFHKLGCDTSDEDDKCTGNDGKTYTYAKPYQE